MYLGSLTVACAAMSRVADTAIVWPAPATGSIAGRLENREQLDLPQ